LVVTMNKDGRSCWWRGKRGSTTLKYVTAKSSPDNRSEPGKFGKSFETDRATADLYHSDALDVAHACSLPESSWKKEI
jgi:hypothetical protein